MSKDYDARRYAAGVSKIRDAVCQVDMENIEARVAAAYGVPLSEDIHKSKACELFGVKPEQVTPNMRSAAKGINFGTWYGMSETQERTRMLIGYGPALGLKNRLRYRRTLALRWLRKIWDRLTSKA